MKEYKNLDTTNIISFIDIALNFYIPILIYLPEKFLQVKLDLVQTVFVLHYLLKEYSKSLW